MQSRNMEDWVGSNDFIKKYILVIAGAIFCFVNGQGSCSITKVTELWNRIENSYIDHSHKRLRPRLHIFACLQF